MLKSVEPFLARIGYLPFLVMSYVFSALILTEAYVYLLNLYLAGPNDLIWHAKRIQFSSSKCGVDHLADQSFFLREQSIYPFIHP